MLEVSVKVTHWLTRVLGCCQRTTCYAGSISESDSLVDESLRPLPKDYLLCSMIKDYLALLLIHPAMEVRVIL